MATDKTLSKLIINNLTQAQYDSATKNEDELYLTPDTTDEDLANKQDKLVSGTNIKTINNESILGSGNISISGGGDSAVGTITFTDSQMYSLQTTGKCTLTSDNLAVIKSSKMVDIVYNSIVLATMSVNMMVITSTLQTAPVFMYHAYSIVWTGENYPLMFRIMFSSTDTSTTFNFGDRVNLMINGSTYLNNKQFEETNNGIYGPQFYQHNIYMLYESGDTTFCVRFQIINNVSDQYTSITSLQNYLGTNFVQGCSGYMTSASGYGNAYSVTASKVSGIVGTSQTSITYTTTGLTITDDIKEMS